MKKLILYFILLLASQSYSTTAKKSKLQFAIMSVFLTESIAFGSAYGSSFKYGDETVGTLYGASGIAVLAFPLFSERGEVSFKDHYWPEFTIPYGLGMIGLSFVNFSKWGNKDKDRLFWSNAIGFNSVILISLISSWMFK